MRQGCPLSSLLFIIAVELLFFSTRSSHLIRGIRVSNKEIKSSQYADDTTVFCRDRHSLKELLDLPDLFQNCSGLKINYSKSEALWLGKDANCADTPFGLKWPQDPISALGTCFSYDRIRCERENFSNKVNQIKKLFNLWSQRDLSLYGKRTIARSLGLSKLIFGCACLPTPAHIIDIVNKMVIEFVWSHKRPKIKKERAKGKGGTRHARAPFYIKSTESRLGQKNVRT